jgi:hypothetical protein
VPIAVNPHANIVMNTPGKTLPALLLSVILAWPSSAMAEIIFQNVASEAGVLYPHAELTPDLIDAVGDLSYMSGGAAAGDFDGDGWMDLYVTRINLPNLLFRNMGDGTFEEMGAEAGVDLNSTSAGCAWADIDNDGKEDILLKVRKKVIFDPNFKNRLNIYSFHNENLQALWLGTKFLYDLISFNVYRSNGNNYLTTVEADASGNLYNGIYVWDHFGFALNNIKRISRNEG